MGAGSRLRALAHGLREVLVDVASPCRRLEHLSGVRSVLPGRAASELSCRIAHQQFRIFVENFPFNGLTAVAGVLLWLAALWRYAPGAAALVWGVGSLAAVGVGFLFSSAFMRANPCDEALRRWEVWSGRFGWLMGTTWGVVGFLVEPAQAWLLPYVAAGSLLVIAASVSLLALYRPSIAWQVVPCALLTSLSLVCQGGWSQWGTVVLYLVAVGALVNAARTQSGLMTAAFVASEERVALLQKIDAQRAAAEQANDAKTRLLAAVSHDLRQPMHSIALLSGALRQGSGDRCDVVDQLGASVLAMSAMLNHLASVPSQSVSPGRRPSRGIADELDPQDS